MTMQFQNIYHFFGVFKSEPEIRIRMLALNYMKQMSFFVQFFLQKGADSLPGLNFIQLCETVGDVCSNNI